jgi:hypothetical protein
VVECRLADPMLTAYVPDFFALFLFFEDANDLALGKFCLFHFSQF